MFVHPDAKRWVAWTPQGYYDAAPGAEDLIGWHVNNGKDQAADFFGAGRFRDTFYRPDVVARVLDTLDEAEALTAADAAGKRRHVAEVELRRRLPPVVTILAPADGASVSSRTVELRYAVRSPSGLPVTAVRVLVDGRPLDAARALKRVAAGEQRVVVPIPARDVELAVVAETEEAVGEPARLRLAWAGAAAEEQLKPKLYALVVGISDYDHPDLRLDYGGQDARDVAAALRAQAGGMYRAVEVRLLADREADRASVVNGLTWLERQTTARDVGLLFLAGHGVSDEKNRYYFLPRDADPHPERRRGTAILYTEIREALSGLAGKALAFLDTCHAADVTGGRRRGTVDVTAVVNDLSSAENGVVVFASSTGREVSVERPEWANGAFTEALLEALTGKADAGGRIADVNGNGALTVAELDLWLAERVKQLTGGQQHPATQKPGTVPDFAVAVVQ
jgi:hypothetical protein